MLKRQSVHSFKGILAVHAVLLLAPTFSLAADQIVGERPSLPSPGKAQFLRQDYGEIEEIAYQPSAVKWRLPNGNVLTFVAIRDNRGEVTALAFAELRRAKNRGIASVPDLARAKPHDIFHALSKPGTVTPGFLKGHRSDTTRSRPQGWARELVLSADAIEDVVVGNPQLTCPELGWSWSEFREDILSKDLPLSFLSEGDGPQSKPKHWRETASGQYRLYGNVHDVPEFYGAVLYCSRDTLEHTDTSDPRVVWRVGPIGEAPSTVTWDFLQDLGDQLTFTFDAEAENVPTSIVGKGNSVSLHIEFPEQGDKFYIGAAWSKISDTLTVSP